MHPFYSSPWQVKPSQMTPAEINETGAFAKVRILVKQVITQLKHSNNCKWNVYFSAQSCG